MDPGIAVEGVGDAGRGAASRAHCDWHTATMGPRPGTWCPDGGSFPLEWCQWFVGLAKANGGKRDPSPESIRGRSEGGDSAGAMEGN